MLYASEMKKREEILGRYIVENKATIRQTAAEFGISRSAVHKYVTKNLKYVNSTLYEEVRKVLDYNLSQRAIRGGKARKIKYKK